MRAMGEEEADDGGVPEMGGLNERGAAAAVGNVDIGLSKGKEGADRLDLPAVGGDVEGGGAFGVLTVDVGGVLAVEEDEEGSVWLSRGGREGGRGGEGGGGMSRACKKVKHHKNNTNISSADTPLPPRPQPIPPPKDVLFRPCLDGMNEGRVPIRVHLAQGLLRVQDLGFGVEIKRVLHKRSYVRWVRFGGRGWVCQEGRDLCL